MSSDAARMDARWDEPTRLWRACTGGVMAIHGEIDFSTCDSFARMMQEAVDGGDGHAEVHVDLGGLAFIDASGARVLVTTAAGRGPRSQLVIHRPPALLPRILEIGWGAVAGLRLEEPRELISDPGSAVLHDRCCASEAPMAQVVRVAGWPASPARSRHPDIP